MGRKATAAREAVRLWRSDSTLGTVVAVLIGLGLAYLTLRGNNQT